MRYSLGAKTLADWRARDGNSADETSAPSLRFGLEGGIATQSIAGDRHHAVGNASATATS